MSKNKTKINVNYNNSIVNVNPVKGTVVTKLTCTINIPTVKGFDYIICAYEPAVKRITNELYNANIVESKNDVKFKFSNKGYPEAIGFTVIAKSVCNKEDSFNETIGKHISITRAQHKAYIGGTVIYNTIRSMIMCEIIKDLDKNINKCYLAAQHANEHVNDIISNL